MPRKFIHVGSHEFASKMEEFKKKQDNRHLILIAGGKVWTWESNQFALKTKYDDSGSGRYARMFLTFGVGAENDSILHTNLPFSFLARYELLKEEDRRQFITTETSTEFYKNLVLYYEAFANHLVFSMEDVLPSESMSLSSRTMLRGHVFSTTDMEKFTLKERYKKRDVANLESNIYSTNVLTDKTKEVYTDRTCLVMDGKLFYRNVIQPETSETYKIDFVPNYSKKKSFCSVPIVYTIVTDNKEEMKDIEANHQIVDVSPLEMYLESERYVIGTVDHVVETRVIQQSKQNKEIEYIEYVFDKEKMKIRAVTAGSKLEPNQYSLRSVSRHILVEDVRDPSVPFHLMTDLMADKTETFSTNASLYNKMHLQNGDHVLDCLFFSRHRPYVLIFSMKNNNICTLRRRYLTGSNKDTDTATTTTDQYLLYLVKARHVSELSRSLQTFLETGSFDSKESEESEEKLRLDLETKIRDTYSEKIVVYDDQKKKYSSTYLQDLEMLKKEFQLDVDEQSGIDKVVKMILNHDSLEAILSKIEDESLKSKILEKLEEKKKKEEEERQEEERRKMEEGAQKKIFDADIIRLNDLGFTSVANDISVDAIAEIVVDQKTQEVDQVLQNLNYKPLKDAILEAQKRQVKRKPVRTNLQIDVDFLKNKYKVNESMTADEVAAKIVEKIEKIEDIVPQLKDEELKRIVTERNKQKLIENERMKEVYKQSSVILLVNERKDQIPIMHFDKEKVVLSDIENRNTLYATSSKGFMSSDAAAMTRFYETVLVPDNFVVMFGPSGSGKTFHTNKIINYLHHNNYELEGVKINYGRFDVVLECDQDSDKNTVTVTRNEIAYNFKENGEIKTNITNAKEKELINKMEAAMPDLINILSLTNPGPAEAMSEILKMIGWVRRSKLNPESSRATVMWTFTKNGRKLTVADAPGTESETQIIDTTYDFEFAENLEKQPAKNVSFMGAEQGVGEENKQGILRYKNPETKKDEVIMRLKDKDKININNEETIDLSRERYKKLMHFANSKKIAKIDSLLELIENNIKTGTSKKGQPKYIPKRDPSQMQSYVKTLISESRYINAFVADLSRQMRTKKEFQKIEGVLNTQNMRFIEQIPGEENKFKILRRSVCPASNPCDSFESGVVYVSDGNKEAKCETFVNTKGDKNKIHNLHEDFKNMKNDIFPQIKERITSVLVAKFTKNPEDTQDKVRAWTQGLRDLQNVLIGEIVGPVITQ